MYVEVRINFERAGDNVLSVSASHSVKVYRTYMSQYSARIMV